MSQLNNLPAYDNVFVGRSRELKALRGLLAGTRLLTICGPGGAGKTRLAVQFAGQVADYYSDGVCFVELAPVADVCTFIQAVSAAVGTREQPGADLVATLIESLGDRQLLFVLDHCQGLRGIGADFLERLLGACPGLRVLATSREPLGAPAEVSWTVPPLGYPEARPLPPAERLLEHEAIRLFVERVKETEPDFELTLDNAPAAVRVCQQLGGIPLALELAAARVGVLDIHQVADRLEGRSRLIATAGGDATLQQTLRAAIEWSYTLLSLQERTLFGRLSVFEGGCTLENVQAVCASDGVDRDSVAPLLARLVERSLLRVQERDGAARYSLPDALRAYARGLLDAAGESERTRRRHAGHYLGLAEDLEPGLWGPSLVDSVDRLETEHDNLRAALRWSVSRLESNVSLRLGAALWRFWEVHGHLTEGLQWLEQALALPAGPSAETLARALDAAGNLARGVGRYEQAHAYFERSLEIHRRLANARGAALALNSLGMVAQFQGNFRLAMDHQEESLELFRQLDDGPGVALALISLGTMSELHGQRRRARDLYEESLALFRDLGDDRGVASVLNNLGNVTEESGDIAAAEAFYEEALSLFLALGDTIEVAACLRNLAIVKWQAGAVARAVELCRDSLRLFHQLVEPHGMAACLGLLGHLACAQHDYERAARMLGTAQALYQATGSAPGGSRSVHQEQAQAVAREMLGEEGFAAAYAEGYTMQLGEIAAYTQSKGTKVA